MRIVIFTDSLGRPRPDMEKKDRTYYEDTYGYKLKHYFNEHEVELLYIESLDTEDAIHWSQRMVAFRKPDLVIYHLGINDCVPRLFKKNKGKIIFNSFFRKITFDLILKFLSYFRYLITKIRRITYVSKKDFFINLRCMMLEVKKYNTKANFIGIGIAKSDIHDKKSFGYNQNIVEYNEVLFELFNENYIDVDDIVEQYGLISDNLHMTKNSHTELFNVLKSKIEEII